MQQQGLQKHLENTLKQEALEFVLVAALACPCSLAACALCSNLKDYSLCNPSVYSVEPLELQPLQPSLYKVYICNAGGFEV